MGKMYLHFMFLPTFIQFMLFIRRTKKKLNNSKPTTMCVLRLKQDAIPFYENVAGSTVYNENNNAFVCRLMEFLF